MNPEGFKLLKWVGAIILVLLLFATYNLDQTRRFRVRHVRFSSSKVSDPIRLVQITDFHDNRYIDYNKLMEDIRDFKPQIIVLTGDLTECNRIDPAQATRKLLEGLAELEIPIYAVLGNHEEGRVHSQAYCDLLQETGVKLLENENNLLRLNGNRVNLIGVLYHDFDYDRARAGIAEGPLNLVLSHSPKLIREDLKGDEDILLCGHLHGGQVRLPLIGALIAPGEGLLPKYSRGLYKLGKTQLYVDSGLGNTWLNLRVHCPIQFSAITIE